MPETSRGVAAKPQPLHIEANTEAIFFSNKKMLKKKKTCLEICPDWSPDTGQPHLLRHINGTDVPMSASLTRVPPHIWKNDSVNSGLLRRASGVSLLVYILAQRYGHGTNTVWGVSGVIWVAENDRDVPVS